MIGLIYLSTVSAEISVECDYKNDTVVTLNNYENTLTCFATITSSLAVPTGTAIKITPLDEVERYQVQHFRLVDQDISNHFDNLMTVIANSFPKLRGIRLGNVSISSVSKDHLKSLPELELLSLDNNKIEVLETDLFMYTPKLRFIYFDFNVISSVNDSLLNSLDYVEVDFSSNPCITKSTCESKLVYAQLKETNPKLYQHFRLQAVLNAAIEENPRYRTMEKF